MGERGRPAKHTEEMALLNFRLPTSKAKRLRVALAEADLSRQSLTSALVLAWMDGKFSPELTAELLAEYGES